MKVFVAIAVFLTSLPAHAAASDASIYQLNAALITQDGKAIKLDVYRGRPTLVTMFYGSCPNVCPLLIETIKRIESALGDPQRNRLRVLLVSIDPDRDTPAALSAIAKARHIDLTRWTLARANAGDVRKIAVVLNIQYRKLPNGDFNHSTVISLLDADGKNIAATSKLGGIDDDFMKIVKESTK